ncbi:hypothetical protein Esti_004070 [Eimeria stiedai]
MLPHDSGGVASKERPSTIAREAMQHDAREQEQQDDEQPEQQSDAASFSGSEEAHEQAGRGGRHHQGPLASSPISAEKDASPRLKRKRTPSRRVVEAAESALLLEQVIAQETSFASRSQSHAGTSTRDPGAHDISWARANHRQWPAAGGNSGCFTGSVPARAAALKGPLERQLDPYTSLEYEYDRCFSHLSQDGARSKGTSVSWGMEACGPRLSQPSSSRRSAKDAIHRIPLCRRPLFGAVEPQDLLGFGVSLGDVLHSTNERLREQRQKQRRQDVSQSAEGVQQHQAQRPHQQQQQQQQTALHDPTFVVDVAVVGAGVAGLAAAAYLKRCGATVMVFEGRHRVGGRTFSSVMPERELPDGRKVGEVLIDLGASYMHCVTAKPKADAKAAGDCRWRREPSRSVSGIAAVLQPLVADVAGKQNWESTLFATWFDEASGRELPFLSVLKVHELLDRLRERTAAKLLHLPPPLTASGGPGPPSASLSNTVPAAEFLSPPLDQVLRAALKRQRAAKKRGDGAEGTTSLAVGDSDKALATIPSFMQSKGMGEEFLDTPEVVASPSSDSPRVPTTCRPASSSVDEFPEDVSLALLQHDTSDPCCSWAATGARGKSSQFLRRGISACRFEHYYPLGNSFVRKAIRAFGGCPLCCTGGCGGASRVIEGKQISASGVDDNGDESHCARRLLLWGSPAPRSAFQEGVKEADAAQSESLAADGGALQSSVTHSTGASGDIVDLNTWSDSARREEVLSAEDAMDGNKGSKEEGLARLQPSPRKECKRQQSRRCSRTSGATCSHSNNGTGESVLKSNRLKKSSTTGAQAETRLVPQLSLHDNEGVRRSAWDALEISLCEVLAEAEAEEAGSSVGGGCKEGTRDCRPHKPRRLFLLSPAEARMLLVVLQSRLGYVGDLRELPVSAVKNYPYEVAGVGNALRKQLLTPQLGAPPVPLVVPPPSSLQRLRMQQAAMEPALQQEQRAHVHPFCASAASSADKLVVDGWGWLPLFLCLQVIPFVVTDAVVQSIHIKQTGLWGGSSVPRVSVAGQGDAPDDGSMASTDDDDEDAKVLAKSHPVRLRVEVNRRLEYRASHGLPQAAEQQERPAHVWVHAKYCVVAVPLAQLALTPLPSSNLLVDSAEMTTSKGRVPPTLGLIDFSPPLGADRRRALARYRMGCHNKVVIRWHPDDVFWGTKGLQLNCLDQKFQFLNLHAYGKPGCLLAHCFPPFSSGYGGLQTDQEVVAEVLGLLQQMFGIRDACFPRPVDFVVSRWEEDCFSRGSYSTPGVNAYDNDLDVMRAPHPTQDPRVLFCGEHLSKAYFQCVDGAFDTGLRAGEAVAHECLQLPLPPREDSRRFALDFFCLPPGSRSCERASSVSSVPTCQKQLLTAVSENPMLLEREEQEAAPSARKEPHGSPKHGFLPQCPFSGFPLPPLPRVLRGHYLTDQSDLGLTDAEGGNWADVGTGRRGPQDCESERRAQQVATSEEYFLACCLSYIKKCSARIFQCAEVQHQQQGDVSPSMPEDVLPDNALNIEKKFPCSSRSATHSAVAGEGELACGDALPPLPSVPQPSESALSFQSRLPTAAQRLFYRAFLSQYPLRQQCCFPTSCEQQQDSGTPSVPKHELQTSSSQGQVECEEQQQLPLLTDLLDAILMCTNSFNTESRSVQPSEASLLLHQAFTRRMRRGGGGRVLDIEGFLVLLARNNKIVRDSVLRPIRLLAEFSSQRGEGEQEVSGVEPQQGVSTTCEPASLERFVKELMLPALPAHARNAKPPRMAAVAAGVLLMETLDRLCAAVPPLAAGETVQERAAALDALVLKSLANSQFVSAISNDVASQGTGARQGEDADALEPLQHEQLCWLCRGEGDLLLCDGLPPASSINNTTAEGSLTANGMNGCDSAPRPCCHVFHMGCAFPPPTPAELQPKARWSCPLCKATAFRERRGLQLRQQEARQHKQTRNEHQQPVERPAHQVECDWQHLSHQEQSQQLEDEDESRKQTSGAVEAGESEGLFLNHVLTSLDRLSQKKPGERTQQLHLQLASCEELQLAALKRLFVDKARGVLACTRQLCKRLDFLSSKRRRLLAAAKRRRWRLRARGDLSDGHNQATHPSGASDSKKHSSPVQQQYHVKPVKTCPSSALEEKTDAVSRNATPSITAASSALRRRSSLEPGRSVGADADEGGGQPEAKEEQPFRRTRRSVLVKNDAVVGTPRSPGRNVADAEAAAVAAGGTSARDDRTEEGVAEISDTCPDEDSSGAESDGRFDQFAAAAQTAKFATALRLLAQVREADGTGLPLKLSALQHLQHVQEGCLCSLQRLPSAIDGQQNAATSEVLNERKCTSARRNSKTEFCGCSAQGSSVAVECLCMRSARRAAVDALQNLLQFHGKSKMPGASRRPSSRCLVPQICSSGAEIDALSRGDPFWPNRVVRLSRSRRPLQPRTKFRDVRDSDSTQARRQQVALSAAQLRQLQQHHSQSQLSQQSQKLMQELRLSDEARARPVAPNAARPLSSLFQPQPPMRAQRWPPEANSVLQAQMSTHSDPVRSLWELLQGAQRQQQQTLPEAGILDTLQMQHLQLMQVQQQLLLQQQRCTEALHAAQRARLEAASAAGAPSGSLNSVEPRITYGGTSKIAPQMSVQSLSALGRATYQMHLSGFHSQTLHHQQQVQERRIGLQQQQQRAPASEQAGSASLQQQQQRHEDELWCLLRRAQQDTAVQQQLKQRVYRLQQLQRHLLQVQQQHRQGSTPQEGRPQL